MISRDFFFGWRGGAMLMLGALIVALLYTLLFLYRKRALASFASLSTLKQLMVPRSIALYVGQVTALVGAWVMIVLALMQPQGSARYLHGDGTSKVIDQKLSEQGDRAMTATRRRKAHEMIFLVDASASMGVSDTRTGITRLDYAKEIIDEVVSRLDGQSVALYAFTSVPTPLVPLTFDYLYTRMILRGMEINEGGVAGTDLMEALETIRSRHLSHVGAAKTVVLLTDGGDTRIEALKGAERQGQVDAIVSRVSDAENMQLRLFVVGLGSPEGSVVPDVEFEGQAVTSSLDESLLTAIAARGRGRYFFGNSMSALAITDTILATVSQDPVFVDEDVDLPTGIVERTISGDQDLYYKEYFQYPLIAAILLLAAALLLPEVGKEEEV